jgi:hypothetical protein
MPESVRPLWDTIVDRSAPILAAATIVLFAATLMAAGIGNPQSPLFYGSAAVVIALAARRITRPWVRPFQPVMYHSDDDGVLVWSRRGVLTRLEWDAIVEVRESLGGDMMLTTRDNRIWLPRHVARRDAFGMAVFERVVPRLAGEMWDGLVGGRMLAISPERQRIAVTLVLALAVGAGVVAPGGLEWALLTLGLGLVVLVALRSRMRGVFLSVRGVGDRDRFIAWEAAELQEHRWALVVRDPTSGWVARIPRTALNYHAIAVVACAAQVLSGSGVESVAFRTANDSGRVRIVVEGNLPGGTEYH